ncbi:hypothetical protein EDD11_010003 [Mortierella claussenii]|nr:hypothetical protein EDD11_010003 [Mortierella claussenii]
MALQRPQQHTKQHSGPKKPLPLQQHQQQQQPQRQQDGQEQRHSVPSPHPFDISASLNSVNKSSTPLHPVSSATGAATQTAATAATAAAAASVPHTRKHFALDSTASHAGSEGERSRDITHEPLNSSTTLGGTTPASLASAGRDSEPEALGDPAENTAGSPFTTQLQDHLKLFFSMHHKLFDLVAFYVVMFAINGQMTSLPTRLEWIGFCVQSIVALRRAFQTSIKHGLGLTSFLGMLDLLVGQLFLHQDRLGLLPTVANILVYFYVINLTRGLVFGDSVSCLLWLLFGLVDIYRKDPSSVSVADLTPYRVIPVHTVGFGLYILMSELVDVMLHSAEPDPIQGRYLNYVGARKEGPVAIRASSRRAASTKSPDTSSNLRFELCITEITPFTVSFCLNALSDAPTREQSPAIRDSITNGSVTPATADITADASIGTAVTEPVDLSAIKIGTATNSSSSSTSSLSASRSSKSGSTPRIISTSDIAIHVNYIPWHQVQYHFPDEQSFTLFGLTPSTDYEIEMKVHQFSSFVTRIGTRAAPPGAHMPTRAFGQQAQSAQSITKASKNRKSKKNQKGQRDNVDKGAESNKVGSATATATVAVATGAVSSAVLPAVAPDSVVSSPSSALDQPIADQKSANQLLMEQLQTSIQESIEAASATKSALKKLKRDQSKTEALLRQELEGIGRGQAKALVQDQKRRQKLSFVQESIKQADAHSLALQEELVELRQSTLSKQPKLDETVQAIRALEQRIQSTLVSTKADMAPLKIECQRLQTEVKRLEGERAEWALKAAQLREGEVAPLQLRLQRLEQQQIVWKVAAEASKEKDREASLKVAALEEDLRKKALQASQLENAIQELDEKNAQLKESVEREMEVWESLERESDRGLDADINVDDSQGSLFSSPRYGRGTSSQLSAAQQPQQAYHQVDGSAEGSKRDAHYWFAAGSRNGSGTDLWLGAGSPLIGSDDPLGHTQTSGLHTHDMGALASESLWEAPSRSTVSPE